MGIERSKVNLVLRHAWDEFRKQISTASSRNIYLRHLGTFRVKGALKALDKGIRDKIRMARWRRDNIVNHQSKSPEELREEVYRLLQYRRFYKRKFKQQKKNRDDYFSAIRDRGTE